MHGFTADIPRKLTPFAHPALPGEGAWRLAESVHGQPAVFTTFLRVDAVHTSYVAGIASFDQRLVRFQLHPGSQDPGTGFGGGQPWIPPAGRAGLLATFNGGFRLSASGGGFYLNGTTSGTLTRGAASMVYYRNGTIKIGQWGRDVRMTSDVAGVRQNLKLIVDHGQVASDINQNVETNFGATLGGAYAVWRSGIGITRDGQVIYVYGPALSAQSLANLLQRAGAVEAMELDINPFWTTLSTTRHTVTHQTPPRRSCCRTSRPPPTATTPNTAATSPRSTHGDHETATVRRRGPCSQALGALRWRGGLVS